MKKKPEPAPALPPDERPVMAPAAARVPIDAGERQAMAPGPAHGALGPGERQAMAPGPVPGALGPGENPVPVPLGPADQVAIGPAATPVPLPASGQPGSLASGAPALAAGTPPEDPLRERIAAILSSARTIAVVGASDKPGKPSHRVYFYLLRAGFEAMAVNPSFKELGGRPAYPDLRAVPVKIDVVDIFRRPEQVLSVVEDAIAVGAGAVWMQEGVVNEEAAARARAAGLAVVMDRCVMKEHRKMRNLPAE